MVKSNLGIDNIDKKQEKMVPNKHTGDQSSFFVTKIRYLVNSKFCPIGDFIRSGFCQIRDFVHSGFCPIRDFVQIGIFFVLDFVQFGIFFCSRLCPIRDFVLRNFFKFRYFFFRDFVRKWQHGLLEKITLDKKRQKVLF